MRRELKILSGDEFGLLMYHIDQLPYHEARQLESEFKETYQQCIDKFGELETLVKCIRNKTKMKNLRNQIFLS